MPPRNICWMSLVFGSMHGTLWTLFIYVVYLCIIIIIAWHYPTNEFTRWKWIMTFVRWILFVCFFFCISHACAKQKFPFFFLSFISCHVLVLRLFTTPNGWAMMSVSPNRKEINIKKTIPFGIWRGKTTLISFIVNLFDFSFCYLPMMFVEKWPSNWDI